MNNCLTFASGWPERFLETYRSLDTKYHDDSMNDVALDGKWSHVEPTSDLLTLHRLCQRMELTSYSSAFSGIDSPGTSFAQLRLAASKITGVEIDHPSHLYGIVSGSSQAKKFCFWSNVWQCIFISSQVITVHNSVTKPIKEWDSQAQNELQAHPFKPKCLFGNISVIF